MGGEGGAVVTGLGLVSSVGPGLVQSCASVRARINRFRECEFYLCDTGPPDYEEEPLIGAVAPFVEPGADRAIVLARLALQDLIVHAKLKRAEFDRAGLYFALRSPARPAGAPRHSTSSLLEALGLGPGGSGEPPVILEEGNTGGFRALQMAMGAIREGRRQACIVVGADSWLDEQTLAWLDGTGRLKCTANPDGLIPGEAAAAFLLESSAAAGARRARAIAAVEGTGAAREADTVDSGNVCTGAGLAESIAAASKMAGVDPGGIAWTACDLNGERYRAVEWANSQVKLNKLFAGLRGVWHPADCLGDIGAASGPALVAIVARAFERGYAPAGRCLAWTSAEEGDRAAVVLKKA